ncbi:DMT family transporter [Alphaproteobacteria bacterium LSUCC0684]|jgi:drug/metabolite transporter (DMT)-like permease|nr:DMT family transporter [Gammaproteobacteria bacterium]
MQTTEENKSVGYGLFLAFIGVAVFSLTLPLTSALTDNLSYYDIGIGRSLIAAAGALIAFALFGVGDKLPKGNQWFKLLITSIGISYGFPILTAVGMQSVPSSHGAIILGGLTLVTALFGAFLDKKRLSSAFLSVAILGFGVIVIFALVTNKGTDLSFYHGDIALVAAVILAGLGYAQGGILARDLGGWRVICWTLIISLPVLISLGLFLVDIDNVLRLDSHSWVQFLVLGLFNSLIGFFFWFRGLALAGVSAASQVQLLQPFLTYYVAVIFLGEQQDVVVLGFALLIVGIIALAQKILRSERGG